MMPRVYISPSAQEHNLYITGGTEEQWMNKIADVVVELLKFNGFEVYRNRPEMTLSQIIADSNSKKPDIHVAMHSNAGGGVGTTIFYCNGSVKGKKLAEVLYNQIAPLTPSKDRGLVANSTFGELTKTTAPATLVEVAFHDNREDANFIINNINQIAKAYAKGICNYFGMSYKEPQPVKQETKAPDGKLYKVQVGAFSIKENAEKLSKELEGKGYKNIIVLE